MSISIGYRPSQAIVFFLREDVGNWVGYKNERQKIKLKTFVYFFLDRYCQNPIWFYIIYFSPDNGFGTPRRRALFANMN